MLIDVSDAELIERLKREIGEQPLDVIINNAGHHGERRLRQPRLSGAILEQFRSERTWPAQSHPSTCRQPARRIEGCDRDEPDGIDWATTDRAAGTGIHALSSPSIRSAPISNTNSCRMASPSRCFIPVWLRPELTGGSGIPPAEAAQGLIERIDALELQNSGRFSGHAEGYELTLVIVGRCGCEGPPCPAFRT